MAKIKIPSASELDKLLKQKKILPVYFICGEDGFAIDEYVDAIRKIVEPQIKSEFDKEVINGEKSQSLSQIIDLALSFPLGAGKRLLIVKNFEKISDRKSLTRYLEAPPDFSVVIFVQYGKIPDPSREPYSILLEKNWIFEVRTETGDELISWVLDRAVEHKLNFTRDFAVALIEITGEEKGLLDMQLKKFADFASGGSKFTFEDLKRLASPTKKYSIFDLQGAIGRGDKISAVEIALNLLEGEMDIVAIINMLAKYVSTIAQATELIRVNTNDNEAARMLNVSWYYYVNCKKARFLMSDERLLNASRALLEADLAVKTSAADPKSIILILISEIMK